MSPPSALLQLPQAVIRFDRAVDADQILVLGGRAPEPCWLRRVAEERTVWAADRGAEICRLSGVLPRHVLGDFDSIGEEGKQWLRERGIETERYPADKDYTDFQLALSRMKGDLLVTGCWGGRFDHSFSNIFSLFWGREWGADICVFADETEMLIPLAGKGTLEIDFRQPPLAVSLLALSPLCEGVGIHGTKWELDRVRLLLGRPYAISNVPLPNRPAFVEVTEGTLGVYCVWQASGEKPQTGIS